MVTIDLVEPIVGEARSTRSTYLVVASSSCFSRYTLLAVHYYPSSAETADVPPAHRVKLTFLIFYLKPKINSYEFWDSKKIMRLMQSSEKAQIPFKLVFRKEFFEKHEILS